MPVLATEKPKIIPPPTPVVIVEKERDTVSIITAAALAAWLTRRHMKNRRPDPVEPLTCPAPVPTTDERLERALELCLPK